MKINEQDPIIKKQQAGVKMCEDLFRGWQTIKGDAESAEKYFPKISREPSSVRGQRIVGTDFPNPFASGINMISGYITRKTPRIENVDEDFLNDCDRRGTPLVQFMKDRIKRSLITGVEFIAVQTIEVDEKNEIYLKSYPYKDLMDFHIENGNLLEIVFRDVVRTKKKNDNTKENKTVYLEKFIKFTTKGTEIWYKNEKDEYVKQGSIEYDLPRIPVVALITGEEHSDFEIDPPLIDVASQNITLIHKETRKARFASLASNVPFVIYAGALQEGIKKKKKKEGPPKQVGDTEALVLNDKQKNGAEFITVAAENGRVLQQYCDASMHYIEQMLFNLITKEGSKTRIDAKENASKSTSFLTDVSLASETALIEIIENFYNVKGDKIPKFICEFDRDFNDLFVNKDMFDVLMNTYKMGVLSKETLLICLNKAKMLGKDFDIDKELERLKSEDA